MSSSNIFCLYTLVKSLVSYFFPSSTNGLLVILPAFGVILEGDHPPFDCFIGIPCELSKVACFTHT